MSRSTSNLLTQQILSFLFNHGAFAWRQNTQGTYDAKRKIYRPATKVGVSDILGCYKSVFIACEIKVGKDRLRPEQIGFLKSIQHAGGEIMVVKDFNDFSDQWKLICHRVDSILQCNHEYKIQKRNYPME